MIKNIATTAICALSLLCSIGYATQINTLQAGMNLNYELQPNEPQIFTNFLFWKLTGHCTVTNDIDPTPLYFTVLSKKGSINGVDFSVGQSLEFTAHSGEKFDLSADANAKVELVNHGSEIIIMNCIS